MVKILFVCHGFSWGGIEQYLLNILDNLDREKFSVEVLLPSNKNHERENDLKKRNIKIIKYPCDSVIKQIASLRKLLFWKKYDIIHFHTGHESALLSLVVYILGYRKIVVHGHNSQSGDEDKSQIHLLKKRIIFKFSEIIYLKFTKRVACSQEAARFMFGRNIENVSILYNGIDLSRFVRKCKSKSKYSLCVNARFDVQKNPFFIIEIMKELVWIEPRVTLEWIGTGELKESVEEKIKENQLEENVFLVGSCNEVEKILSRNKFFLLPSKNEGLGIVLMEAQAMNMKCFISDAIPDIANCGGCIVIPLRYNAKQWAEIIYGEMNRKEEMEIDKNQLEKFDIQNTTKELEKIYLSMM